MENKKSYTTDGKVKHLSSEEDINVKLGKIIGEKFVNYRKTWDAANKFQKRVFENTQRNNYFYS